MWSVKAGDGWEAAPDVPAVAALLRARGLGPATLVRHDSWPEPRPLSQVPELAAALASAPPAGHGARDRAGFLGGLAALGLALPLLAFELYVRARALEVPKERWNEGDSEGCGVVLLLLPAIFGGPFVAFLVLGLVAFAFVRGRRVLPLLAVVFAVAALGVVVSLVQRWS